MTPQFTHDCERCTFLTTENEHDLYFCGQRGYPTVIARYGNDGPEYKSGLIFSKQGIDPELTVAYQLATEQGLL